jgi:diguanylate cyclase
LPSRPITLLTAAIALQAKGPSEKEKNMETAINNDAMPSSMPRDLLALPSSTSVWLQQLYAGLDAAGDINKVLDRVLPDTRAPHSETWWPHSDLAVMHQRMRAAEARISELETMLAQANKMAYEDALTGTLNRRGLEDALEREMARGKRKQSPLSVALLDLDNFKMLNDTHGHSAGDEALIHLVQVVRETLRNTDIVGRLGGEEFLIVLADTPLEEAAQTIMRVQRELNRCAFMHKGERLEMSFSAGVTLYRSDDDQATLIARSDEALYKAKMTGKNRVVSVA